MPDRLTTTLRACTTESTAYLTNLLYICIGQPGAAVLLGKGDVLSQHVLAQHGWINNLRHICCNVLSFLHNSQGCISS